METTVAREVVATASTQASAAHRAATPADLEPSGGFVLSLSGISNFSDVDRRAVLALARRHRREAEATLAAPYVGEISGLEFWHPDRLTLFPESAGTRLVTAASIRSRLATVRQREARRTVVSPVRSDTPVAATADTAGWDEWFLVGSRGRCVRHSPRARATVEPVARSSALLGVAGAGAGLIAELFPITPRASSTKPVPAAAAARPSPRPVAPGVPESDTPTVAVGPGTTRVPTPVEPPKEEPEQPGVPMPQVRPSAAVIRRRKKKAQARRSRQAVAGAVVASVWSSAIRAAAPVAAATATLQVGRRHVGLDGGARRARLDGLPPSHATVETGEVTHTAAALADIAAVVTEVPTAAPHRDTTPRAHTRMCATIQAGEWVRCDAFGDAPAKILVVDEARVQLRFRSGDIAWVDLDTLWPLGRPRACGRRVRFAEGPPEVCGPPTDHRRGRPVTLKGGRRHKHRAPSPPARRAPSRRGLQPVYRGAHGGRTLLSDASRRRELDSEFVRACSVFLADCPTRAAYAGALAEDHPAAEAVERVSLMLDASRMMVNVLVDGFSARALVDTGATTGCMSATWLDRLPLEARGAVRARVSSAKPTSVVLANDHLAQGLATLPEAQLTLAGQEIVRPLVVMDLPAGIDVILGTGELRQLRARINFDGSPLAQLAIPTQGGGFIHPEVTTFGSGTGVTPDQPAPDIRFDEAWTTEAGADIHTVGAVRSRVTSHVSGEWERTIDGRRSRVEMCSPRSFWAGRESMEGVHRVTLADLGLATATPPSPPPSPPAGQDPPRVAHLREGVDIDATAPGCAGLRDALQDDAAFSNVWKLPCGNPQGTIGNVKPMELFPDPSKPPPRTKRFTAPHRMTEVLQDWVKDMLQRSLIEPTFTATFTSPIFAVEKPRSPGEYRVVCDLRELNNSLADLSQFAMPDASQLLTSCANAQFTSALDLKDGFYSMALAEKDRDKTAFTVKGRNYRFTVAPMGCSQTPNQFANMVNTCLREYDLLGDRMNDGSLRRLSTGEVLRNADGVEISAGFVLAYVDDILVVTCSDDPQEHDALLRKVLAMMHAEALHLKFAKCHWFTRHVRFLGHVVGEGTLRPDPTKTATVARWTDTDFTSITPVRSFLGMANFYRRYIPDYATRGRPLFDLLKVGVPFRWTPECSEALAYLQRALLAEPVLRQPDFTKPFTLSVDASDAAVGAVLHQDDAQGQPQPVEYYSASLDKAQLNYSARDKEALALVKGVKHFKYFLHGSPFKVRMFSDHRSLMFLQTQSELSGRLWRWYEELSDYNFEIRYVQGTSNVVADALSRLPAVTDAEQGVQAFGTHLGGRTDMVGLLRASDTGAVAAVPHMFWDWSYAKAAGHLCVVDDARRAPRSYAATAAMSRAAPVRTRRSRRPAATPPATPPPHDASPGAKVAKRMDAPRDASPPVDELVDTLGTRYTVRFDGQPPPYADVTTAADLRFPARLPYSDDPESAAIVTLLKAAHPDKVKLDTMELVRAHARLAHFSWRESDERLHYRDPEGHLRLVIPRTTPDAHGPDLRTRVILSEHATADKGHRGADATIARLQRSYYWPYLARDVKVLVAGCHCQGSKASTSRPMGLLQPLEPPLCPHSHATMDLITGLEPHPVHGYDTLLVYVCRYSKYVTLIPCRETLTGLGTIDLLKQHVFATFRGFPLSLVSDRDPRWTSAAFQQFCTASGIKHSMSTANHPQSDGQTERTNRSIEEVARSFLSYDHSLFWDLLPDLAFAINDSPLSAMADASPFEICHGQSPLRPTDIITGTWTNSTPMVEPVRARCDRMYVQRRVARELLREAAANMTVAANRRRRPIPATLRPGAKVWVKSDHIMTPEQRASVRANGTRKLQQKYHGPYLVLARVGNVAFKIDLPADVKAHPVIHADALKLHTPHNIAGLDDVEVEPLFLPNPDGTTSQGHEVAEILDARRSKRGKFTEYLVKWKYYPLSQASYTRFAWLGAHWQAHIPAKLLQPLPAELKAAGLA
eukprot:m.406141 g.406141  ORF g.406141 m.406141 type:complete len:1992 (+) comp16795_c5_seq4:1114-7089(+)